MDAKQFIDCERKRFDKLINFRLPHRFMYIGIAIAALSIVGMFIRAFVLEGDTALLKTTLQKTILVGLLLISISKDRIEDEMTIQLRSQSYMVAFIIGVIYALAMPYIEFGISNAVHAGGETLRSLGDFQVLLFMLMVQLMFYHNLKRFR